MKSKRKLLLRVEGLCFFPNNRESHGNEAGKETGGGGFYSVVYGLGLSQKLG